MKSFSLRACLLACALAAFGARAEAAPLSPGEELRISLLTMSPGDPAFTKFGHDALLVENTATGATRVYNYGTFVFDSPWLAVAFLRGNLRYWLSVSSLSSVVRHYAAENRSIFAQELRIEAAERARIARLLEGTERSDARYYKYDYYRDNCATRVRDVIDGAIAGRLRAASNGPAPFTYRQETLRLTADDVPLALGLDVAMGPLIDRPLSTWESEFLPARLQAAVRSVRVPGANGDEPLVVSERVLLPAKGRTTRDAPPGLLPPLLATGLALGALWISLGVAAGRGSRAARGALSTALPLLGLAAGLLGCTIAGLFSLTDHAVTYYNANVLLATPWSVALPAFARGISRGDVRALGRAGALCTASLASSTLVLVALPFYGQRNGEFVALFLPLWLGASAAIFLFRRGLSSGAASDNRRPAR
ncbi:MAG TPA: DUF4105 domain-containing protein [Polyangiaceae bacterium]|nr:DUF4105 domain-containing protein [Polyangiaceae bacterium]